ncbi:helix-turn-helix domain-containing protein [Kocuria sp. WRN011]|uniref:helix-turn-helix domain-containing protein n=1 Tax=Kocuria sp. WRN011 TaxID=2029858 RepID=UPI00211073BE|nr:helix-turn-helix domain-containing protein [Kocuria sp. WRN011]
MVHILPCNAPQRHSRCDTYPCISPARARGRTGGRPSRLSADQVRTARRLYEQQDMTVAQIGDVLGVSRTTIYRTLAKHAEPVARRRAKPSPTM